MLINSIKERMRSISFLPWLRPEKSDPAPEIKAAKRIIFIDDCIPHPFLGAGLPRSHAILLSLAKMGHSVTLYPMSLGPEKINETQTDAYLNIEIISGHSASNLAQFLKSRPGQYDLAIISRPHNMRTLKSILKKRSVNQKIKHIIYDAEALFTYRKALKNKLLGTPLKGHKVSRMIDKELQLSVSCDAIFAVSSEEKQAFIDHGAGQTHVLKHSISISPTENHFNDRCNILFVGPMYSIDSPNTDSVRWFLNEIFPLILKRKSDINFIHAGIHTTEAIKELTTNSTKFMGKVMDLGATYNNARLFVAPTRFSAGIPLKVYEAAAHGLPVVCTSLLAKQLEWSDEIELLVADTPEEFASQCLRLYQDEVLWIRIRAHALARVQKDCAPGVFYNTLKTVIDGVLADAPSR
jgi:glycosyltransferase involved in cell wall biosynthesis